MPNTAAGAAVEQVEMAGHIVDSLLLPKVLDAILTRGGQYHIEQFKLGERQDDTSYARIEVRAPDAATLDAVLAEIHPHGAVTTNPTDCKFAVADVSGAFPEGFYCSTNFRTQVRVGGAWVPVNHQEMDCGVVVGADGSARCVPMTEVQFGERVVVGRAGTRVFPPEAEIRKQALFEFMASPVSSERPKAVTVREIAKAMRNCRTRGEKILAVLGPAVIHTGAGELVLDLIRANYLDILFTGNAFATHDIEQAFYGTSLGVSFDHGLPTDEGHEHHLRTINTIRRLGGIANAVSSGKLAGGVMAECSRRGIPFVLAGSIRDDGPLPEVETDILKAQNQMRALVPGVGFCLMVASTLHSVAVGNLLPAWVKVACIDINPATVTKLMDRGTTQTVGIVSDAEPFLRSLVAELLRN